MVLKFDNFKKHVGRCKCKVAKPNCSVGQYYMFVESQYAKNERLFCDRGKCIVVNMVVARDVVGEKEMKFIQFVAIFWLLKQGCPMTNFEVMKFLFFKKWSTFQKNINMTMLTGRLQNLCITLFSL